MSQVQRHHHTVTGVNFKGTAMHKMQHNEHAQKTVDYSIKESGRENSEIIE